VERIGTQLVRGGITRGERYAETDKKKKRKGGKGNVKEERESQSNGTAGGGQKGTRNEKASAPWGA